MTKQYASQTKRTHVPVTRSIYRRFAQWCKDNNFVIQHTFDELMQMCIEGELEIRQKTEIKRK